MILSEPVSEALIPIYNQLQTLKRILIEVKDSGGVSSVRELYPYSMKVSPRKFCYFTCPFSWNIQIHTFTLEKQKLTRYLPLGSQLNMIDNMRVDGRFMHGDDIPEGQGALNELLADCYELAYELRVVAEAKAEETQAEDEPRPEDEPGTNGGSTAGSRITRDEVLT